LKKFIVLLIFAIVIIRGFSQDTALYIPASINSPLFNKPTEVQIGARINNYGLNFDIAACLKNKFISISFQQNNGSINFDPLNFNDYRDQSESTHLIQSRPTKMIYLETAFGYFFFCDKRKFGISAGFGRQFQKINNRCFAQVDWGAEGKWINAGISLRCNYTKVKDIALFVLEPVTEGKIKLWDARIVAQFGYSIALKKKHDYMKPILTIGLEYVF
jgi:hypothetical protein